MIDVVFAADTDESGDDMDSGTDNDNDPGTDSDDDDDGDDDDDEPDADSDEPAAGDAPIRARWPPAPEHSDAEVRLGFALMHNHLQKVWHKSASSIAVVCR